MIGLCLVVYGVVGVWCVVIFVWLWVELCVWCYCVGVVGGVGYLG